MTILYILDKNITKIEAVIINNLLFWFLWFMNFFHNSSRKIYLKCVDPNSQSFFCSKFQKFTVLPKRSLASLQQKTKFYSSNQTVILVFIAKYKNLQLYPSGDIIFLQQNTKFWKLYSNGYSFYCHTFFDYKIWNFKILTQMTNLFLATKYNIWSCPQTVIRFLTTPNENRTSLIRFSKNFNDLKKQTKTISLFISKHLWKFNKKNHFFCFSVRFVVLVF